MAMSRERPHAKLTRASIASVKTQGRFRMGILSIIGLIIVGFIVGMLARFFYPARVNLGFWMTVLLGIGGSLVGGVVTGLAVEDRRGAFTARDGSCRSWAPWH